MEAEDLSPAQHVLALAALLEYPTPAFAQGTGVELERLENTHVRLFLNDQGGVKAPPFAGCYLDQEDRLEFMVRFSGLCRQQGIMLGHTRPPDYIPLMMEVLALLITDGEAIPPALRHCFSRWPARFADTLRLYDDTGVYAAVAAEINAAVAVFEETAH